MVIAVGVACLVWMALITSLCAKDVECEHMEMQR
jgi:hypothetical protein